MSDLFELRYIYLCNGAFKFDDQQAELKMAATTPQCCFMIHDVCEYENNYDGGAVCDVGSEWKGWGSSHRELLSPSSFIDALLLQCYLSSKVEFPIPIDGKVSSRNHS